MKRFLLACLALLLAACQQQPPAPETDATPTALVVLSEAMQAPKETFRVDTRRSVVRWKGTKFLGAGFHEGVVRLASGTLQMHEGVLLGGTFTVDMRTIEITDIPESEPIPRRRLKDHLVSDHYFDVARYPTARLVLTRVDPVERHAYRITGDLTIRGQTHPVTFDARIPVLRATSMEAAAQLSIDRHDWGVSDRGCRLVSFVVDDAISLDLALFATRQ